MLVDARLQSCSVGERSLLSICAGVFVVAGGDGKYIMHMFHIRIISFHSIERLCQNVLYFIIHCLARHI